MNVLLEGDTHGRLESVAGATEAAALVEAKYGIVCGDFGYGLDHPITEQFRNGFTNSDTDWRYIRGNHDDTDWIRDHVDVSDLVTPGVHPTPIGNLSWIGDGTVEEIGGMLFGFIGGAESLDSSIRTEGWDWWADENIDVRAAETLVEHLNGEHLDILVCHEIPDRFVPYGLNDALILRNGRPLFGTQPLSNRNREILDWVWLRTQPAHVVHGHYHAAYDVLVTPPGNRAGVRTWVHGLGYNGVADAHLVVDTDRRELFRLWPSRPFGDER